MLLRHPHQHAAIALGLILAASAALAANGIDVRPEGQRDDIGIEPVDGGRRPTLHALRHTFAVERIRRWYQEGVDVQALLPHLSVYLGHIRPQESYWYLSATPELLTAAAARFQYYAIRGESS